jgi:hypothetical protein
MTWPQRGSTRGQRLLWTVNRRKGRPTAESLNATRQEVAALAVLRLLDALAEAALIEAEVTPRRPFGRHRAASRRLAIARELRDATRADFLAGSTVDTNRLWDGYNAGGDGWPVIYPAPDTTKEDSRRGH